MRKKIFSSIFLVLCLLLVGAAHAKNLPQELGVFAEVSGQWVPFKLCAFEQKGNFVGVVKQQQQSCPAIGTGTIIQHLSTPPQLGNIYLFHMNWREEVNDIRTEVRKVQLYVIDTPQGIPISVKRLTDHHFEIQPTATLETGFYTLVTIDGANTLVFGFTVE